MLEEEDKEQNGLCVMLTLYSHLWHFLLLLLSIEEYLVDDTVIIVDFNKM